MSIFEKAKTGFDLVILAAVGFVAYKGYKAFQDLQAHPENHPALAGTLQYWGILGVKPGQQIQNINPSSSIGSGGAAKLTAEAGPHTEYAYNQALSHFAFNHGFPNGDTAAASDDWPCDASVGNDLGFTDWKAQGFPNLPL